MAASQIGSQALDLKNHIHIQSGAIVSQVLAKTAGHILTLFAMDQAQQISSHASPMEAYVHVLEGEFRIQVGDQSHQVKSGEILYMPAQVPHALDARTAGKFLLTMIHK